MLQLDTVAGDKTCVTRKAASCNRKDARREAGNAAATDCEMAIEALGRSPHPPAISSIIEAASRLVTGRWATIARLAAALEQRGKLDYTECLNLAGG
jgi:hypothetical protein